jgi:hypothetical protein
VLVSTEGQFRYAGMLAGCRPCQSCRLTFHKHSHISMLQRADVNCSTASWAGSLA